MPQLQIFGAEAYPAGTPGLIGPSLPTIRREPHIALRGLFLDNEWLWAAMICAVPFIVFGLVEAFAARRRKRFDAIARRSKSKVRGNR
jgi:hypothetical protein